MRTPKILWFAIAWSTVIYLVIAYMLHPVPARPFAESVRSTITLALYAAAFAAFVVALVIPNLLVRLPAQQKMMVALAMFEACAIFGLVAAFTQQDWRIYVPAWI